MHIYNCIFAHQSEKQTSQICINSQSIWIKWNETGTRFSNGHNECQQYENLHRFLVDVVGKNGPPHRGIPHVLDWDGWTLLLVMKKTMFRKHSSTMFPHGHVFSNGHYNPERWWFIEKVFEYVGFFHEPSETWSDVLLFPLLLAFLVQSPSDAQMRLATSVVWGPHCLSFTDAFRVVEYVESIIILECCTL